MISGRVLLFAGACGAILFFGICRAHASRPGPDGTKIGTDIEGVVSDSASGERVPGANVTVRGTYTLVVSAVGYQLRTIPVAVSGTGAQTVNIKLAARLIETREVVVETQSISARR